jgi:hypothetical protein
MGHPNHEQIATRAYEIWQQRGASHGGHEADWFQAEQELAVALDKTLVEVARKVGTTLGTVVAFLSDPLHSSSGG